LTDILVNILILLSNNECGVTAICVYRKPLPGAIWTEVKDPRSFPIDKFHYLVYIIIY